MTSVSNQSPRISQVLPESTSQPVDSRLSKASQVALREITDFGKAIKKWYDRNHLGLIQITFAAIALPLGTLKTLVVATAVFIKSLLTSETIPSTPHISAQPYNNPPSDLSDAPPRYTTAQIWYAENMVVAPAYTEQDASLPGYTQ